MNRNKYYKLYDASEIKKTQVDELIGNIFYFHDIGLNLHNKEFVYFGKELARDLKKNEKIFQKN